VNAIRLIVAFVFFVLSGCSPGTDLTVPSRNSTGPSGQIADPANTPVGLPSSGNLPAPNQTGTTPFSSRIVSHAIIFTELPESAKESISEAAASSHAGMIRMDLTWASLQPSAPPAVYDWHWVDESIRAAKKNNLEILALITETPAWASKNPTDPDARFYPPKPEHLDEWEAFITAFVDRYGAKGTNEIHYWEIWGEANDSSMWKGSTFEYAHLYSLAYDAVKDSDPAAQVLMAGMNETDQPEWLEAVLNDVDYPARDKIDIIDVHVRGSVDHVKAVAAGWRAAFESQGILDKPIWITEFGFPSSPVFQGQWDPDFVGTDEADGEQKQADYYNIVIPWLLTDGGIDKIFVTLRDVDAPGTPWASEGFFTLNGTPKEAFNTIQALSDLFQ
jgi:hypothetical protein